MKVKHKLLKDYQYISPDKKIFQIKSGTIIEDYIYNLKGEQFPIDKDIIEANPEIFNMIDWKSELLLYIKSEKLPQPSQICKKIIPFIDDILLSYAQKADMVPKIEIEKKYKEINEKLKELDNRELSFDTREKRILISEEDISLRLSRLEERESQYRQDLNAISIKNDDIRVRLKSINDDEVRLQSKELILQERERNIDKQSIENSNELDARQKDLMCKIESDLVSLKDREAKLEKDRKEVIELKNTLENEIENIIKSNKDAMISNINLEIENIKSDLNDIYRVANTLSNFHHPIVLESANDIILTLKRLRSKLDNF